MSLIIFPSTTGSNPTLLSYNAQWSTIGTKIRKNSESVLRALNVFLYIKLSAQVAGEFAGLAVFFGSADVNPQAGKGVAYYSLTVGNE